MDQDVLKTNMLAIAVAGLLILLTGVFLYLFRNQISSNVRYFIPIPPIGVAAYIFVFNMYAYYDGELPASAWGVVKEILYSTAISAGAFIIFTVLLIFLIDYMKR